MPNMFTLLVFLFPLAYSPGPGNLFFAALGAQSGFRASLPANAGYHLSTLVVTAAIGAGFAVIATATNAIWPVIQAAGGAYVVWLGYKLGRSSTGVTTTARPAASLWDGVVLLLLNPKAYLIIAVMFANFLPTEVAARPTQQDQLWRVFWITVVFTLNNLVAFVIWTLAGQQLVALFQSPRSARRVQHALAVLLSGVGLWLLISAFFA